MKKVFTALSLVLLAGLAFADGGSKGDFRIIDGGLGIGPASSIYVTTTPATTYFIVDGNAGIGYATPTTKLYVNGTTTTTALNIGIGTASPTRLCIANNAVAVCP